jgi:hypothetical protein
LFWPDGSFTIPMTLKLVLAIVIVDPTFRLFELA